MNVPVRLASVADAPVCADIVNNWIDATRWISRLHSCGAIEDMIVNGIPIREFWVAGSPVVGYLSFNPGISQIMGLYTARPSEGIGKALMDRVKKGRTFIQLWSHEANTEAHCFYRREGFIEAGKKAEGADGIPEIRMEWRLPDAEK